MTRSKIVFHLEQDEDGYPPFGVETVWASAVAGGGYEIENIPFFAHQATLGDTVAVTRTEEGLVFERVVHRSENSLIRVVVHESERFDDIFSTLKGMGCTAEAFSGRRLIAVSVPATVDLHTVQAYLADLEATEIVGYEEPILRQ